MCSWILETNKNDREPYRHEGTKPVYKRSAGLKGRFHPELIRPW